MNNIRIIKRSRVTRQVLPLFEVGIPRSGFQQFRCETNKRTVCWHTGDHHLRCAPPIKKSQQPPMLGVMWPVLTARDAYEGCSEYCRETVEISSQEWRDNVKRRAGFPQVSMLVHWRVCSMLMIKCSFVRRVQTLVSQNRGGVGSRHTGAVVRL